MPLMQCFSYNKACTRTLTFPTAAAAVTAVQGALLVPLMRHQKLALAWMVKRETSGNQPIGGILADDQGLGKTVGVARPGVLLCLLRWLLVGAPQTTCWGCFCISFVCKEALLLLALLSWSEAAA